MAAGAEKLCHGGVAGVTDRYAVFWPPSRPLCNGRGRDTCNSYNGVTYRKNSSRCLQNPLRNGRYVA
ncbi:hypothetical protein COLO4_15009 [Corchorus olitorius]|uniref:Uncharacterized protein n=1 Tax=Corchorus olitorius TaxID=93759 RepID=A0A1R3JQ08_9ROSI|nr:hypothetical protein COLO4_15009 [Corchorus olitorius]